MIRRHIAINAIYDPESGRFHLFIGDTSRYLWGYGTPGFKLGDDQIEPYHQGKILPHPDLGDHGVVLCTDPWGSVMIKVNTGDKIIHQYFRQPGTNEDFKTVFYPVSAEEIPLIKEMFGPNSRYPDKK